MSPQLNKPFLFSYLSLMVIFTFLDFLFSLKKKKYFGRMSSLVAHMIIGLIIKCALFQFPSLATHPLIDLVG